MRELILIAVVFLVLDAVFLISLRKYFANQIFDVQRSPLRVNYLGALLCYGLLIGALYYFILRPRKPVLDAFIFGICIYGVYETTSYALLRDWRLQTVAMDTLWGGVLMASTTAIVYTFKANGF